MKNGKRIGNNDEYERKVTRFFEGRGCLGNLNKAKKAWGEISGEFEKSPERLDQFLEIAEDVKPFTPYAREAVKSARNEWEVKKKREKRRIKKEERFMRRVDIVE